MRLSVALALAFTLASSACSSSTKEGPAKKKSRDPYATVTDLCAEWAKRACNDTVVAACAAPDAAACQAAQSAACEDLHPSFEYSSEGAKECLDAVEAAYADGRLTSVERAIVQTRGAPCDLVEPGDGEKDSICQEDGDCNKAADLSCVRRAGQRNGTCQVAETVKGGFPCTEPHQMCEEGFYCDGSNCIARVPTAGAACAPTKPCASSLKCEGPMDMQTCEPKLANGQTCAADLDCQSGLCLMPAARCTQEIILSPSEAICSDFQ